MSNIIRTVWTYRVNGQQMGTYSEDYARGMFETLAAEGASVELVAVDHVAADFAATGRNWTNRTRVVATTVARPAELAVKAAELATAAAEWDGVFPGRTHYYHDAYALLSNLFQTALEQGSLSAASAAYNRLVGTEGHRVHRLLTNLKRGRVQFVLDGLLAY